MSAHLHQAGNGGLFPASAPVGYSHQIIAEGEPNPVKVKPGSLVYLWPPGVARGENERVLARVERTTTDTIVARDVSGDRARAGYEVGRIYPDGVRWTWELAAEPERPTVGADGLTVVDRRHMSVDARREWLFGPRGATVRLNLKDGSVCVGVPVEVMVDGDEWDVQWVRVQGPNDQRGNIAHRVKFEDISLITIVSEAP